MCKQSEISTSDVTRGMIFRQNTLREYLHKVEMDLLALKVTSVLNNAHCHARTHRHTHAHMSRLWLFNFFSAWSLKQEYQCVVVCNCCVPVRCQLGIVHLCSVVTSTLTSPSRRFEIGTTPTPDLTSCVRRTMLVEPRLWRCYGGTGSICMKEFSGTSWRWTRWLKRRNTISTNFLSWSLVYRFNVKFLLLFLVCGVRCKFGPIIKMTRINAVWFLMYGCVLGVYLVQYLKRHWMLCFKLQAKLPFDELSRDRVAFATMLIERKKEKKGIVFQMWTFNSNNTFRLGAQNKL